MPTDEAATTISADKVLAIAWLIHMQTFLSKSRKLVLEQPLNKLTF